MIERMKWLLLVLVVGRAVGWELTLLHVNDIHVRMEETNKYSAACRSYSLSPAIIYIAQFKAY
jgi:hypothetical protein